MTPGTELVPLEVAAISRTTLALFAGASGDHNPVHIDLDVARSAGLDDVFAHGMLSMAYLARLVTDNVAQGRICSLQARFLAVTPVHARLTVTGTVTEVRDGRATITITIALADGTPTVRGTAVVTVEE
jgi:acyl dehydratase